MTGMCLYASSLFSRVRNCQPFITGILISRKIRSGLESSLLRSRAKASAPSVAWSQMMTGSTVASASENNSRSSVSSSINKNRFFKLLSDISFGLSQWKPDDKGRPSAQYAGGGDRAMMAFHNFFAKRQAQSGSLVAVLGIQAHKGLEDPGRLAGVKPDAVVGHCQLCNSLASPFRQPRLDGYQGVNGVFSKF